MRSLCNHGIKLFIDCRVIRNAQARQLTRSKEHRDLDDYGYDINNMLSGEYLLSGLIIATTTHVAMVSFDNCDHVVNLFWIGETWLERQHNFVTCHSILA